MVQLKLSANVKKFENKLLQNLENLYTSNNEEFWNLLEETKCSSTNRIAEYQILPTLTDLDKNYK